MDSEALRLSVLLAVGTVAVLLPIGIGLGRWLATSRMRGRALVEATLIAPMLIPPTVIGFYLLIGLGPQSVVGHLWRELAGTSLTFSFSGILLASILVNLPLAVQPAQRAFENVGADLRDAAATCGMGRFDTFRHIELPLAWPGVATGMVLCFAHTLGEFGVILMVGGSIPGETRTLALSIYDRVQAFDNASANTMAATLVAIALSCVALTFMLSSRSRRHA